MFFMHFRIEVGMCFPNVSMVKFTWKYECLTLDLISVRPSVHSWFASCVCLLLDAWPPLGSHKDRHSCLELSLLFSIFKEVLSSVLRHFMYGLCVGF